MWTRAWMLGGLLIMLIGCGKSSGSGSHVEAATGVTLADLVGTWDVEGSGTIRLADGTLCAGSGAAEFTIATGGALTETSTVKSSCLDSPTDDSDTGTVSVDADGGGLITYSDGSTEAFQVSKDLNTMVLLPSDADEWSHSVALRR